MLNAEEKSLNSRIHHASYANRMIRHVGSIQSDEKLFHKLYQFLKLALRSLNLRFLKIMTGECKVSY